MSRARQPAKEGLDHVQDPGVHRRLPAPVLLRLDWGPGTGEIRPEGVAG